MCVSLHLILQDEQQERLNLNLFKIIRISEHFIFPLSTKQPIYEDFFYKEIYYKILLDKQFQNLQIRVTISNGVNHYHYC